MARVAKAANTVQSFRGGRNRLGVWAKFAEGSCCEPGVALDIDRLPATVQWENANVHTNPLGGRNPTWRFSELQSGDAQEIVDLINTAGVGAVIELQAIPTFAFVTGVAVTTHKEETGLTFEVITRNGTPLPNDRVIHVEETDPGANCGGPARTIAVGSLDSVGALGGATRAYEIAHEGAGGSFALEADVIALRVVTVPAGGVVNGTFDIAVDLSYTSTVRSNANS